TAAHTLYLHDALPIFRTAAKIARILGEKGEAEKWEKQAEASSEAIHNTFYDSKKAIYADGSMANQAAALLAGVVPEEETEKVVRSEEHTSELQSRFDL